MSNTISAKEFAEKINGFEYPARELAKHEDLAKESGLLFIYGQSDDLIEFGGIISNEENAYNGYRSFIGTRGVKLEMVWCPSDMPNTSFRVDVDCPHETFDIVEDGEIYCRGVVIHKDDLNL